MYKLLPGIHEHFESGEMIFIHSKTNQVIAIVNLTDKEASVWKSRSIEWNWEDLFNQCSDPSSILAFKKLWNTLKVNHLLLQKSVFDHAYYLEKGRRNPGSKWNGFSNDIIITKDKYNGWWLDNPHATCSIWSGSLNTLEGILQGNLNDGQKAFFLDQGFGHRDSSMMLADAFWIDSTRFLNRLGPYTNADAGEVPKLTFKSPIQSIRLPDSQITLPERKSIRGHQTSSQLTLAELSSLLFKVFSITEKSNSKWFGEVARFNGPSGGGAFETDAWIVANNVKGIDKGLYRYNGSKHELEKFEVNENILMKWIMRSQRAWGSDYGQPQCLLSLMSDLQKLPVKYARLSAQLAFLNAGVRLGEINDFCDSNKLSCCDLGGGILSDLGFEIGVDPLYYTSVADVALGGKIAGA